MSSDKFFLVRLFKRYAGRLSVVFIFNLLAVLFTLFIFLMIEPFCKLLFNGTLENISPITTFLLSPLISHLEFSLSHTMLFLLLGVALVYFFKTGFSYLAQWFMASIRSDLLFYYRNNLYQKILRLPLSFFSDKRKGDVVSRAVSDIQEMEYTILSPLQFFMTEPITIIFYLLFLFIISPQLTLFSLLSLPVSFLIIARISSKLRKNARTAKQRLGSILSHVEETISGLRIIMGFNAQDNAAHLFQQINAQFTKTQTKIYRRTYLASPLSEFLGVAMVMVVLVFGGKMVLANDHKLTAELFITFIALFTQLITPIKNISNAFANYKRGMSSLDRINEIMDAKEEDVLSLGTDKVSLFKDSIIFDNVSFAYNEAPVLSHLTFEVKKGEMVALVGQSGSGKTTLTDILERFYLPQEGNILLDGKDISSYTLQTYRSLFSLVSQDVILFNDTLYNNITLGYSATEEEIKNAIRVANIESFVSSLPNGLQYTLTDRGLNLSGGQRQRISIARAVLRNAPILILDEATSAMDTESEFLVQQALDAMMKNRTVFVVAHRLSTIQQADKIIVLDNGSIIEQGTHDSLMAKNGVYSNLVKIQKFN